jgi:ADP-ribose pyrophosphatase YjhB (NUDIX family)
MRKGAQRENNRLRAVNGTRIPCVGAIVRDGARRLLLIKRGHDPEAGRWSLPGGRIAPARPTRRPCGRRDSDPNEDLGAQLSDGH